MPPTCASAVCGILIDDSGWLALAACVNAYIYRAMRCAVCCRRCLYLYAVCCECVLVLVLAVLQGSLGDSQLYAKMEQASQLIKRDIVFAASLYVN